MDKSLEERSIELAVERRKKKEDSWVKYLSEQREEAVEYFSKSIPEAKFNEVEDKFYLGVHGFSYKKILPTFFSVRFCLINPNKYAFDYRSFPNSDIYNLADFGEFLETELKVKGK